MDISQAAFGLDMRSASRIYFVSPVLNPQVEAQAIGRARRISQQNQDTVISVETLVLKDSIEELIVARRRDMTAAEHRRVKNILDDRPMHDWIRGARILPMPTEVDAARHVSQTARLDVPQFVFGRDFGRELHPDDDLVMTGSDSPEAKGKNIPEVSLPTGTRAEAISGIQRRLPFKLGGSLKRPTPSPAPTPVPGSASASASASASPSPLTSGTDVGASDLAANKPPKKKVRIAFAEEA